MNLDEYVSGHPRPIVTSKHCQAQVELTSHSISMSISKSARDFICPTRLHSHSLTWSIAHRDAHVPAAPYTSVAVPSAVRSSLDFGMHTLIKPEVLYTSTVLYFVQTRRLIKHRRPHQSMQQARLTLSVCAVTVCSAFAFTPSPISISVLIPGGPTPRQLPSPPARSPPRPLTIPFNPPSTPSQMVAFQWRPWHLSELYALRVSFKHDF